MKPCGAESGYQVNEACCKSQKAGHPLVKPANARPFRFFVQRSLEVVLQTELDIAGVLDLAGDLAECRRIRDVTTGSTPADMVQTVEHFHAEIHVLLFGHLELLPDGHVQIEEGRCTKGADADIAEGTVGGTAEGAVAIVDTGGTEVCCRDGAVVSIDGGSPCGSERLISIGAEVATRRTPARIRR